MVDNVKSQLEAIINVHYYCNNNVHNNNVHLAHLNL